jgi:hypothetical protein
MNQVAINGWVFNFNDMVATRFTGEYGMKKVQFKVKDGKILKWSGEREFFDPPEDNYNAQIADACASYFFEKELFTETESI